MDVLRNFSGRDGTWPCRWDAAYAPRMETTTVLAAVDEAAATAPRDLGAVLDAARAGEEVGTRVLRGEPWS